VETVCDRDRLLQVLDNLLANVRAHTPPGTATTVTVEGDRDTSVVTIADDGPGLDPEQVSKVFERFYRAEASRSRTHGGAGLGLSIVAAIVAAHGGDVSAASEPGGGTSITIRLPAAMADSDALRSAADEPVGPGCDPTTDISTGERRTGDLRAAGLPRRDGEPASTR
jgi:two-component system, OmpR family, sensor kinase